MVSRGRIVIEDAARYGRSCIIFQGNSAVAGQAGTELASGPHSAVRWELKRGRADEKCGNGRVGEDGMRAEPSLPTEPLLGPLSPTNDVKTDRHTNPGRRKHDKQERSSCAAPSSPPARAARPSNASPRDKNSTHRRRTVPGGGDHPRGYHRASRPSCPTGSTPVPSRPAPTRTNPSRPQPSPSSSPGL